MRGVVAWAAPLLQDVVVWNVVGDVVWAAEIAGAGVEWGARQSEEESHAGERGQGRMGDARRNMVGSSGLGMSAGTSREERLKISWTGRRTGRVVASWKVRKRGRSTGKARIGIRPAARRASSRIRQRGAIVVEEGEEGDSGEKRAVRVPEME